MSNPATDSIFILLPPFICLAVIALFPATFQNNSEMALAGWIVLILLIDVGHVYSTLYRTYFDNQAIKRQAFLLYFTPFAAFIICAVLYSVSPLWFWRLLTYAAVFHFVRQQYGFMRLYSRYESKTGFVPQLEKGMIYAGSIYPLLYWHLNGPRNFNWFIKDDFFYLDAGWLLYFITPVYICLIAVYVYVLLKVYLKERIFNLPKFAIIAGTAVSWYFGIVYFNGDMAFTLLNVVSHGIPYMALVWIHGNKQRMKTSSGRFLSYVFSRKGLVIFILVLCAFAFLEEFLWDIFVWDEHRSVFGGNYFSNFRLNKEAMSILVPLLTLPQLTHYILDGFIWKIRKDEIKWNNEADRPLAEDVAMGLSENGK
ncbi:MAG: hypothetical protein EOO06_09685 [Chitinophagaceae bacterium]|nr:MAG: hypothetical protein EOO06_09685 [Chitinophagaceae bacterium]